MPFLHENGNVTITPTSVDFSSLKASPQAGSRSLPNSAARLHRILQREGVSSSFSGGGGGGNNLQSQLAAQAQRRAAQRKLQMAKMMGNGGMASAVALNFQNQRDQNNSSSNSSQNDPMFVASRRARSNNFTLKETFDLLKIWASPEMQWQMKHNFRNFRVWEAISFSMHELGHERTAIQCKNRIQNLTSIFYRIKKSKQDYRSFNFPYYKLIGDVLDGKKNGTSSITPPPGVNLTQNGSAFSTNSGSMTISPTSQNASAGFAAHLALVEEYQHLINGNPEIYMTPTGRSSSNNSNSGLNVLSPEVSLSEGNSPIRVENQAAARSSNSASASSSVQKVNAASSRKGNGISTGNSTSANSCSLIKLEPEDCVTVTVEHSANDSEMDNENHTEDDLEDTEQLLNDAEDCRSDGVAEGYPSARTKRSFSASFAPYHSSSSSLAKSESLSHHGGGGGGNQNRNPAKRARVGSTSAASASGLLDDPIGQYLAEMVEIERQWLDLERERAENERQMMVYMMQVLQAIVCPGAGGDDDDNNEENDAEGDGLDDGDDGEGGSNHRQDEGDGFHDDNEDPDGGDGDDNDIHEMIANGGDDEMMIAEDDQDGSDRHHSSDE